MWGLLPWVTAAMMTIGWLLITVTLVLPGMEQLSAFGKVVTAGFHISLLGWAIWGCLK